MLNELIMPKSKEKTPAACCTPSTTNKLRGNGAQKLKDNKRQPPTSTTQQRSPHTDTTKFTGTSAATKSNNTTTTTSSTTTPTHGAPKASSSTATTTSSSSSSTTTTATPAAPPPATTKETAAATTMTTTPTATPLHTRMIDGNMEVALYNEQRGGWPRTGKHVVAHYTDDAVVVYQAYNRDIAAYAAANGRFLGAPGWSDSRTTWVKPNFLWMMHRSAWGTKHNQQAVVAIWLRRQAFNRLLGHARIVGEFHESNAEREVVRLQWDPDYAPSSSSKHHLHSVRRDIQLGLKKVSGFASGEDIVRIVDLSDFVAEQRANMQKSEALLEMPVERVYPVSREIASVLAMGSDD
ncbi:DUF4291 family protein [Pelomyxa schiedti]|nr:DUF4291 family protein [Pelomyxa schiedti]